MPWQSYNDRVAAEGWLDVREAAERLAGNARRLGIDAFHASLGLEIGASLPGRVWVAICCYCLELVDPHDTCPVFRLELAHSWCPRCPRNGADVLVAAIPGVGEGNPWKAREE
jgi:hypothetical protein